MAGSTLQLFPPPPRPRQASPNRRVRTKPPTPEPEAERLDSAKSTKPPMDLHELIIKVNSVPASPASTIAPLPVIAAPPRIHIPNSQPMHTPPKESQPTFQSPQPRHPSPELQRRPSQRTYDPRAPSPSSPGDTSRLQRASNAVSIPDRGASPAFSTSATLVRANSNATHFRDASPQEGVPMRSMFPIYDPTKLLNQQAYQPTQASPTHIPRTQISRSPYSPDFYVPHSNIAEEANRIPPPKPFFTPSNLLDDLWLAANGQGEPSVQVYTLRMHRATAANPTITFGTTPSLPFYSLAQSNLAGSNQVQSIMNELIIQRHHPTQPRVLPVSALDLMAPPSMNTKGFDPQQQESVSLLTTIFPKLAALQALDAAANSPAASHLALADPGATSPAAQRLAEDVLSGAAQRECCALTWNRDNPEQQSNPWASHMPSEGSYQLCHPTLGNFPVRLEGDCSVINKPSTRPVTAIYGHNMASSPPQSCGNPASITILNPYILSPEGPQTDTFTFVLPPPPRFPGVRHDARPTSFTPSEMSITQLPTTTDAGPDDTMLARLDLANDALTLNVAALTRFGNPFLVDVAASALLAVAVAEAVRGRNSRHNSQDNFDPPPPSFALGAKKDSDVKAFKEAFRDGFNSFGGKVKVRSEGLKKWGGKSSSTSTSRSESFDKDIELGEWFGQGREPTEVKEGKKRGKKASKEEKLPFVTRGVISVLMFAFKAVVFVLRVAIKIVAGVVVMITKNFSRL